MKRIAVISRELNGFNDFLHESKVNGKFNGRSFISDNDETYVPILSEENIRGCIFDEVIELKFAYMNHDYDRITRFIKLKEFTCMKECVYVEPCYQNEICLNCGSGIIHFPRKGYFAKCSHGYLGLITYDFKKEVTYPDGNSGHTYIGVHISDNKNVFGKTWSSRNPEVIGKLNFLTLPNMMH